MHACLACPVLPVVVALHGRLRGTCMHAMSGGCSRRCGTCVWCCLQSRQALDMLAAMEAAREPTRPILDLCLQARSLSTTVHTLISALEGLIRAHSAV